MQDAKSPIKVYLKRGNCWGVRTDHGGVDWIPTESNRPPSEFTPCEAQYELQRILCSTAANSADQPHTFNGKHEPVLPSETISKSTHKLCTQRTSERTDVAQTTSQSPNLRNPNQQRSTELEDLEGKCKVSGTSQSSSQEVTAEALKSNGLLYNPRTGSQEPSSSIWGFLTQFISNYLYFPGKKVQKKINEIKSRNEIESNKLSKNLREIVGKELYTEKIQEEAHKIWELRLKNTRDSDKRTSQDDWDDAKESLNKSIWQRFCQWTGIGRRTAWDWMQFLVPGLALFFATQYFTEQTKQKEQNIAQENRQDEVVKNYLDEMNSLLLDKEHPLRQSKKGDESRSIATTLTEAALRQLSANQDNQSSNKSGNDRKGLVIRFLAETDLIQKSNNSEEPAVPLQGADLSGADLSWLDLGGAVLGSTNLRGADLSNALLDYADFMWEKPSHTEEYNLSFRTDLTGANLSEATINKANFSNVLLNGANLNCADLSKAVLSKAVLDSANLNCADLSNTMLRRTTFNQANLKDAKFSGAIFLATDLRNAKNLTQAQLETCPPLLCNVALPAGFKVDPNRDCDRIPQELTSRYPDSFKTVEDAKKVVDEERQVKWD